MKAARIDIQTADAFDAEGRLLALDAVVSVSIVTGTTVRVKYKPDKIAPDAIAGAVGGFVVKDEALL